MKPPPFKYHAPRTVRDATALLATLENAKILAGGQSLMPMLNLRYVLPDHIVDINRISELSDIAVDGDRLVVGAMTRQRELAASALVRRHCPLMTEALEFVGHMQTRSRGTIGGSLCHLDPAAELPAVMLAHDAVVTVANESGSRELAIDEWFAAYMTPNLEPTELLRSISIPLWRSRHGYAFVEFARRRGDFALAGIGCLLALNGSGRIERASVVVCGVDTRPHRCSAAEAELAGAAPDAALFERAARHAGDIQTLDDSYADKSYRQRLAKILTERALAKALSRISEAQNG